MGGKMSTQNSFPKLVLFLTICLFTGMAACASGTEADPRAWIDFPRDGATIPVGSLVTVVSHASAQEGVAEVLLLINGEAYRRDPPAEAGASFSEIRQEWLPDEAGLYTLQVKTYDATGAVSSPHGITIQVVAEVSDAPPAAVTNTATATETAVPMDTPSPTQSPTQTQMPTQTATATLAFTPTATPTSTNTPTLIPPTATATPTMTPTPTFTPTPTPTPPDTIPPPVPTPMVPANDLPLSCRTSQTLAWLPVEDESGIAGYYVKLERQVVTNQWDPVGDWGPLPDKQIDVEVQCGPFYRWAVRALDGSGNLSSWSAWSHFSVGID